jgi:hypothetical protein
MVACHSSPTSSTIDVSNRARTAAVAPQLAGSCLGPPDTGNDPKRAEKLRTNSTFGDLRDSHVLPAPERYTCDGFSIEGGLKPYASKGATFLAGFIPHRPRKPGEPVFVTFLLRNTGAASIGIETTGYVTFATKHPARFEITALGPTGAPVADADGSMEVDNFGLLPIALAPGATYVGELLLADYRVLDAPGRYTITAKRRTMGWDKTETNVEIISTFELEVAR